MYVCVHACAEDRVGAEFTTLQLSDHVSIQAMIWCV